LAPITASSLFEYDARSLAHPFLGSFSHSSLQKFKLHQVGWEAQPFSDLSTDVQSGSSLGLH